MVSSELDDAFVFESERRAAVGIAGDVGNLELERRHAALGFSHGHRGNELGQHRLLIAVYAHRRSRAVDGKIAEWTLAHRYL